MANPVENGHCYSEDAMKVNICSDTPWFGFSFLATMTIKQITQSCYIKNNLAERIYIVCFVV